MIFQKKRLEWTLEVVFFSFFVIFVFHGAPLGHVSGHVGTCHVEVQKMKKKGLGKLICLDTKILKIGSKLRELWPWQSKFSKVLNAWSMVHEKWKSQKFKKILLPGPIPAVFLEKSSLHITQKNKKNLKKKFIFFLHWVFGS